MNDDEIGRMIGTGSNNQPPLSSASFSLWRQDDNGNRFLVGSFARREDAEKKINELSRQLHKQLYWITETPSTAR